MKRLLLCYIGISLCMCSCCNRLSISEIRSIATEAYVYAYPMIQQYADMYAHCIDKKNADFRAPLNEFYFEKNTDNEIVGELWLDLRSANYVLHVPPVRIQNGLSIQFVDLQCNNCYDLPLDTKCCKGDFLLLGRNRELVYPDKEQLTIPVETDFVQVLIKIQPEANDDFRDDWSKIVEDIYLTPLYTASGRNKSTAKIDFPPYHIEEDRGRFYGYMSFLLQFCNAGSEDMDLMKRFSSLGIIAGTPFVYKARPEAERKAIEEGLAIGERLINSLYGERLAEAREVGVALKNFFPKDERNSMYGKKGGKGNTMIAD